MDKEQDCDGGAEENVEDYDPQELSGSSPEARAERKVDKDGDGATRCRKTDKNSESMEPFEGLKGDAVWKTKRKAKSGASVQRVMVLQEMIQAFIDERLNAARTSDKAAKHGR